MSLAAKASAISARKASVSPTPSLDWKNERISEIMAAGALLRGLPRSRALLCELQAPLPMLQCNIDPVWSGRNNQTKARHEHPSLRRRQLEDERDAGAAVRSAGDRPGGGALPRRHRCAGPAVHADRGAARGGERDRGGRAGLS